MFTRIGLLMKTPPLTLPANDLRALAGRRSWSSGSLLRNGRRATRHPEITPSRRKLLRVLRARLEEPGEVYEKTISAPWPRTSSRTFPIARPSVARTPLPNRRRRCEVSRHSWP